MTYQEALTYLNGFDTFGVKLGLVRIQRLLELMDHPQNRYKTIHVTGTNGKGSTSAMLAEILSYAKIKTGMYTSPHLVSYTERMRIDGKPATEEAFADCVFAVKQYVDQMIGEGEESPTQFEVITAAAFYYFAKMQVEYAVIEVGLGGLLDSTNVIVPEVSVITNVAFEHADVCGGTLAGIAEHKAGIIKEGVPVVTAAKGEALEIIRKTAADKNADLFIGGEDFKSAFERFDGERQKLNFSSDLLGAAASYSLRLLGLHQIENSAVAIMTALIIANTEKRITDEVIHHALSIVEWDGRFEIFRDGDCAAVIDGAHNLAGIDGLRRNLDQYFPDKERVFLLGILKDKDVDGMVRRLIRPTDQVVVTQPDSRRAARADFIAGRVRAKQVEYYPAVKEAYERAAALAGNGALLCATGSLYLVGAVRELMRNKNRISN